MSEFRCDLCGHAVDTPQHELGCHMSMSDKPEISVNGKPMGEGIDGMLRALHEMVPAYGVSVDDPDELRERLADREQDLKILGKQIERLNAERFALLDANAQLRNWLREHHFDVIEQYDEEQH